jgi:hypothetical protein
MKEVLKDFIEPSQAIESRRQRYLGHGHTRLMKKMFREKNPPCLCDNNWRSPKVLKEQSS